MESAVSTSKAVLKRITIRCYAGLNDFLSPIRKQRNFPLLVKTPVTVREVIESLGIPLSEIDLILVNSEPETFEKRLYEYDHVSLYPAFENINIDSVSKIRKPRARSFSFILDAHLGKLAKYLRMLGFDTLYRNDYGDREILEIASDENRIILSRDKLLLKVNKKAQGYFVRATEKHEQLIEIVKKFDLCKQFRSFTRCMTCNGLLVKKDKSEITDKIDKDTARIFSEFFYCENCDKVFWKGSHFERMEKFILSILT